VNEFDSGRYDDPIVTASGEQIMVGEAILVRFGFTDRNGEPYSFEWSGWAILFALCCAFVASVASVAFLSHLRFATGQSLVTNASDESEENEVKLEVKIPFQKVDLTFYDIHYTVKASTSNEQLELLKGIDGCIEKYRLTALMGSSGAGKTSKFHRERLFSMNKTQYI